MDNYESLRRTKLRCKQAGSARVTKRRSKGVYTGCKAFRRMGVKSRAGRHGQAALSGSKPKAPGSAGGYLLSSI